MLVGITPRKPARTWVQNESLLHSGITPIKITRDNQAQIVRAITLYRRSSAGAPDNSYLDVATLCTFDAYRAHQDIRLTTRFADHKAADTALQAQARKGIITTTILKAELLAIYQEMIDKGWVEDFDTYRTELIVEADTATPGRFNYQDVGANFVTPLHIIAGKVSPVLTQGGAQ